MNGVQVTSGSADGGGTGTGAGTGNTRNTGNSGTGNTRNTGNSGSNTEEGRPREINIVGYAKQRAAQIVELLDAVDNRTLISGEVTKGPRTALQRLPRHIRRRAMSYNIRRFPRHQRKFAASTIALSRHRKKPPCRLWRRRPRNLLLNYIRRQRANVWLETHVWHAKRFRMCRKWGYRIPLQSYQRSFRPTYRDTMRHCVVRDTSFMRCFQIQISCQHQARLIDALRPLCEPATGATFAFKSALDGGFEVATLLYEPGRYPRGLIGPIRFCWSTTEMVGEQRSLIIWCHPSASACLLKYLIDLLKLAKEEGNGNTSKGEGDGCSGGPVSPPKSLNEWHLQNSRIRTAIYKGDSFKLIDLSDQLIRFRLHGPQSFAILRRVLKTVKDEDCSDDWMEGYRISNNFWNQGLRNVQSAAELPDGTVLSLLVEDPRLSRPTRKSKPSDDFPEPSRFQPVLVQQIPAPRPEFWHLHRRQQVLASKLSESDLQKQRAGALAMLRTTPAKIPVVLVIRNDGSGTSSTFAGVDLIGPGGFGMEFWLALQYGTAHAAALRDQKAAEFEANRLNFPADVPDCGAGRTELDAECKELVDRYLARPHNRRIAYWSTLSIKFPFTFEWSLLARDWSGCTGPAPEQPRPPLSDGPPLPPPPDGEAYVLRDRRQLLVIEKWFCGKAPFPEQIFRSNQMALIAVRLDVLTTGRPQRFGLICAPTEDDYRMVGSLGPDEKTCRFIEPKRRTGRNGQEKCEDKQEDKNARVEAAKRMQEEEGYIELSSMRNEKPISLSALFPDQEFLRNQKRVAIKRMKRQKAKAAAKRFRKAEKEPGGEGPENPQNRPQNGVDEADPADDDEKVSVPSYRQSCSRPIIGRVVRGDYSFCAAKGRAVGYCSLMALKEVSAKRNVLFRNATSKYYHPARISVLRTNPDL